MMDSTCINCENEFQTREPSALCEKCSAQARTLREEARSTNLQNKPEVRPASEARSVEEGDRSGKFF